MKRLVRYWIEKIQGSARISREAGKPRGTHPANDDLRVARQRALARVREAEARGDDQSLGLALMRAREATHAELAASYKTNAATLGHAR
jgi:hypothetical protein